MVTVDRKLRRRIARRKEKVRRLIGEQEAKLVYEALNAAQDLAEEGISLEVIDPRTLVPLDRETIIRSVKKTGRLVVVDEACQTCGAAAEIVALVTADKAAFSTLKAAPARVCGLDVPIPFSPPMEKYAIPDKTKIVEAVRDVMRSAPRDQ